MVLIDFRSHTDAQTCDVVKFKSGGSRVSPCVCVCVLCGVQHEPVGANARFGLKLVVMYNRLWMIGGAPSVRHVAFPCPAAVVTSV